MAIIPLIFIIISLISFSSSTLPNSLSPGSSLSVENREETLVSPNGVFSAGFYPVGENAYSFAIWFTQPSCFNTCTVVWMANRDIPINGKSSKLSLQKTANIILTDADDTIVWSSNTFSSYSSSLNLNDNGNLVLITTKESLILWQSFDSPTDTLLPLQPITKNSPLVSSRSSTNFSSGFYKLSFHDDNVLRLVYEGLDVSSTFWPKPWLLSREAGRSTYNSSRIAVLDSLGKFSSSDNFSFLSSDYGDKNIQRRLTLDLDGNLRLYSRKNGNHKWVVSWLVSCHPCKIHGACGPNSICKYIPSFGRKCSCLPGYKMKNVSDWSLGCEAEVNVSCDASDVSFHKFVRVEMYGFDLGTFENHSFDRCKEICLKSCDCKGFTLKYVFRDRNVDSPHCFPKSQLYNGYKASGFGGNFYLKVPKSVKLHDIEQGLSCSASGAVHNLERRYLKSNGNKYQNILIGFVSAIGLFEILAVVLVWIFLIRTQQKRDSTTAQDYFLAATTGFKSFSYNELKIATKNFSEEIGKGGAGIVYKGELDDKRIAAIKRLNDATQSEDQFLAEVSTVGKINHMNLLEMWGYCAEGKHRFLVYDYVKNGSLANNLYYDSNKLGLNTRFKIALGIAKGLAYLHEECLEWILHCDVKPENILLDSNYEPKVSDFGLSRLLSRGDDLRLSKIRGTRGYMAPEWIFNLPITSKVDVYSYGIVVLEMITGRNPSMGEEVENKRLVEWVLEKKIKASSNSSWVENIIDPVLVLRNDYDAKKMETLIRLALMCVEENKDGRPTMSQVVKMILQHHNDQ